MVESTPTASPSRSTTPVNRFTTQGHSAEDLLKEQTVGLVHLSDFKRRRAEIEDSREVTPVASGPPLADRREPAVKKRKKTVKKGGLSFGDDEDGDGEAQIVERQAAAVQPTAPTNPPPDEQSPASPPDQTAHPTGSTTKKRLRPNGSVAFAPKALTKAAVAREAQLKEQLRKEYLQIQEAVKQTDFCLPFVFFAGKASPGGVCRMAKGDAVWVFLERARKVGADMAARGDVAKRDWARISVDDLLLVRGDLIIPHHYDFHYFMLHRSTGYNNQRIFPHAATPTAATPAHLLPTAAASPTATTTANPALTTGAQLTQHRNAAQALRAPDAALEGFDTDPAATRVVDRRWYERHRHIFPASTWEAYAPDHDYTRTARTDGLGNAMFFTR